MEKRDEIEQWRTIIKVQINYMRRGAKNKKWNLIQERKNFREFWQAYRKLMDDLY